MLDTAAQAEPSQPHVLSSALHRSCTSESDSMAAWYTKEYKDGAVWNGKREKSLRLRQTRPCKQDRHTTHTPFLRRVPKLSTRSAVPRLVANLGRNEKEKAGATSQQSNCYMRLTLTLPLLAPPDPKLPHPNDRFFFSFCSMV